MKNVGKSSTISCTNQDKLKPQKHSEYFPTVSICQAQAWNKRKLNKNYCNPSTYFLCTVDLPQIRNVTVLTTMWKMVLQLEFSDKNKSMILKGLNITYVHTHTHTHIPFATHLHAQRQSDKKRNEDVRNVLWNFKVNYGATSSDL